MLNVLANNDINHIQGTIMKRTLLVIVLSFLSLLAHASDVCDGASREFAAAVEVYKQEGGAAFMKRFLKNGPLENDTRSLSQAQTLGQIEQFFGPLQGSSVLSTKALGAKSCYIIGILEYENGPAFAVANYYSGSQGIGATSMFFRTEPEQILPKEFLVQ
ncbi:hypothetical protein BFW38_11240 [Terasakiispira papahanaumokuakeensis]|uniref:DUF4019 domain-containing protein n=1 Tax=Terasakiispira papahanaumokuakeensis TaxID=197479 RepID=A0A1E2VBI3_9GAMM|nr:hypothetical protein [Terasakiispira papahanaumokuakeensis]ODC04025.1 hypothetical protein BFW38_11240 [Terasakiispira papahanaumokuakeensis]